MPLPHDLELERRNVLEGGDLPGLTRLLAEHPSVATTRMAPWDDHPKGADVLGYLAMVRFHNRRLTASDTPDTAALASALIAAGAPVDGHPDATETPLITAASYGDAHVARVLIEAGADVNAVSAPTSGGVPSGSVLQHAAVYGMTDVLDLLVAAGVRIASLEMAAAAGDIDGWPLARFSRQSRLRALVFAADHERLPVLDTLVAFGTPVNEPDAEWHRLPLHIAAGNGRATAVEWLLAHGADPDLADPNHHRTPLDWCAHGDPNGVRPGHRRVAALLTRR